jgi:CRP-like cAMP-binding protein
MSLAIQPTIYDAALARFAGQWTLTQSELHALQTSARSAQTTRARARIAADERSSGNEPMLVLSGFAYRSYEMMDGRRQILAYFLPGEMLWRIDADEATVGPVLALTDVAHCTIPSAWRERASSGLAQACARSAMLDNQYLHRQIIRLGRLNAMERLADWVLELHQRATLAGLAHGMSFKLPLTQEIIADTLGLTHVHINRTLQTMRREGLIEFRSGVVTLLDRDRLMAMVDYRDPQLEAQPDQGPIARRV